MFKFKREEMIGIVNFKLFKDSEIFHDLVLTEGF
jgi:hypothetical protein